MAIDIQLKRGTKAKIDALALKGGLLEGEPLFITDESKFAIATSSTTYQVYVKETPVAFDVRTINNNSAATSKITWSSVIQNIGNHFDMILFSGHF